MPAAVLPRPAAARPLRIAGDPQRILVLKCLDRSIQAIRHVGVDGVQAVGRRPRAHPAGDRLVIGERRSRKGIDAAQTDVVHGSRGGRGHACGVGLLQRSHDDIRDPLRGFDVARRHACRQTCSAHRACARHHRNRPHQAGIVRRIVCNQAAETVHDRRVGHRAIGVHAAARLRVRLAEIDRCRFAAHGQAAGNAHRPGRKAVVVEAILEVVAAVRQGREAAPHEALGIVLQLRRPLGNFRRSVLGQRLQQAPLAYPVRGDLRAQVAAAFLGRAHVGQDQSEQSLVVLAVPNQSNRRYAQPLLKNLGSQRHGAGHHAADVGVVSARGQVERWRVAAARKHGGNRGDVGQVRPSAERVVQEINVPAAGLRLLQHRADRDRHGAQMRGHVIAHRHGAPVRVVNRAGIIAALLDIRRKRGAPQHDAHFLGDRDEKIQENLKVQIHAVALRWAAAPPSRGCRGGHVHQVSEYRSGRARRAGTLFDYAQRLPGSVAARSAGGLRRKATDAEAASAAHAGRHRRDPTGRRQLVRPPLSRPPHEQRRSLRHEQNDRGASGAAVRYLASGQEPGQRPLDASAHQRPRPVRQGQDYRPLARRSGSDRHDRRGHRPRAVEDYQGAETDVRFPLCGVRPPGVPSCKSVPFDNAAGPTRLPAEARRLGYEVDLETARANGGVVFRVLVRPQKGAGAEAALRRLRREGFQGFVRKAP